MRSSGLVDKDSLPETSVPGQVIRKFSNGQCGVVVQTEVISLIGLLFVCILEERGLLETQFWDYKELVLYS